MSPLVSIIVPFYNMEQFLAETLDSVLQSNYSPIEIILMDDGSKDQSLSIAKRYEETHENIHVYTQQNKGVAAARNAAIAKAKGKYIFPLDSDDKIAPDFLGLAVAQFENDSEVEVVYSQGAYFGDKEGLWKLPDYSRKLLARKNMISVSSMYKKESWERVGGYTEEVIAREDWIFWISVLKDGGKVVKLPNIGFYYRIRPNSKRKSDRHLKKTVIDTLNKHYPDFFQRELKGPLRYHRSWSVCINSLPKGLQNFLSKFIDL